MPNPKIAEEGKKYQFGQPGGNKPNGGGCLGGGKTFRQWCSELMFMNDEELRAFEADETKPFAVRRAAKAMLNLDGIKEVSCAADIIESKPVQVVENRNTNVFMTQEEFLDNVKKSANEI